MQVYLLTITSGEKSIVKEAKDEKGVRRLVNIYYVGTQAEKEKIIQDILNSKEHGTL